MYKNYYWLSLIDYWYIYLTKAGKWAKFRIKKERLNQVNHGKQRQIIY